MDSDIRIVCIQVSPGSGGEGSLSSVLSGQRGEIRAVLERAMDSLGPSGGPGVSYEAHLNELMSRALPSGRGVRLPAGQMASVSTESGSEAASGSIVKVTA